VSFTRGENNRVSLRGSGMGDLSNISCFLDRVKLDKRRARENLQGIARDQLLEMPPLPQVKKPKWYRGKIIVSDGPLLPSVATDSGSGIICLPLEYEEKELEKTPLSREVVLTEGEDHHLL
jgi:hypothetical protein